MHTKITLDELELHSVPLTDHISNWFFIDMNGQPASPEHQDQIWALTPEAAKFLWDYESSIRFLCSDKYFREISVWNGGLATYQEIKKYLFNLGIPFSQRVFLAIQPDCGFVVTWKMVIKYAHTIFWANDMSVFDRTSNWRLEFHHDGEFTFGKGFIYNGQAEKQKENDLYNMGLKEMEQRKLRGTFD